MKLGRQEVALRVLLALIFGGGLICDSQNIRGCNSGTSCILLADCPALVKLVQDGSRESIRQVRRAICGFQAKHSLVCCPATVPLTSNQPVFTIGSDNESLLPRPGRCGRPATEDKIIGGAPAPFGSYPWLAAMGYREPGVKNVQFLCSGSIINSKYLLTAAHCVDPSELGRKKLSVIHLGDWNLTSEVDCQLTRLGKKCFNPHIVAGFEEIISHPQYNIRARTSDDIALIRLNVTLNFDSDRATVEPVCLPTKGKPLGNRRPIAAGWGLTEHGNYSDVILRVDVPITSDSLCQEKYKARFVGNQLCVGGEGGFDTCSGDSGGPLVLSDALGPPFTQIGIVSFGPLPCAIANFPGVYTSVADYRDWIVKTIRP